MKNMILVTLISCLCLQTAYSQIDVGLKFGIGQSNVHYQQVGQTVLANQFKPLIGFEGGIALQHKISKSKFYLCSDILFSSIGARNYVPEGNIPIDPNDPNSPKPSQTWDERTNYISIPFFIKYDFFDFLNVQGGLNNGFLLNQPNKSSLGVWKTYDPGFLLGMNIKISHFELGVNYKQGLMNIRKENDNNKDFKFLNELLVFGVSYKIIHQKDL